MMMDTNAIIQEVIQEIENAEDEKNRKSTNRRYYSLEQLLSRQYVRSSMSLPIVAEMTEAEAQRKGLWRQSDCDNEPDFSNFGPTKYIINLRRLAALHFEKVDSARLRSAGVRQFGAAHPNETKVYDNHSFPPESPCDRVLRMLIESAKNAQRENICPKDTGVQVEDNKPCPAVEALLKNARLASELPTVHGRISVTELEGRQTQQSLDDGKAFRQLLQMCGISDAQRENARKLLPKKIDPTRTNITPEEFNQHVKAVMEQAEQRFLMNRNIAARAKMKDLLPQMRRGDTMHGLSPGMSDFQTACSLSRASPTYLTNNGPVNPWDSVLATQRMNEEMIKKSYY